MTNILKAISNIVNADDIDLSESDSSNNRANAMGDALETYIKDAFAGTFKEEDEIEKTKEYGKYFSYTGNQNNPPDIMIRGGDAIEVKKIQSPTSALALNSSYPKCSILASSPMITDECKTCEEWDEKDLIYAVGYVPKSSSSIKTLWLYYGSIFAANHSTYTRIKDNISTGVNSISDIEFSNTKELGRVNRVDPLGITYLRIRGMWGIENPSKVFNYLFTSDKSKNFELVGIIPKDKYDSFDDETKKEISDLKSKGLNVQEKQVKDPNNPVELIDVYLLTYTI